METRRPEHILNASLFIQLKRSRRSPHFNVSEFSTALWQDGTSFGLEPQRITNLLVTTLLVSVKTLLEQRIGGVWITSNCRSQWPTETPPFPQQEQRPAVGLRKSLALGGLCSKVTSQCRPPERIHSFMILSLVDSKQFGQVIRVMLCVCFSHIRRFNR